VSPVEFAKGEAEPLLCCQNTSDFAGDSGSKVRHLVTPPQPFSQSTETLLAVCRFIPNGLEVVSGVTMGTEATNSRSAGGCWPRSIGGADLAIF
jgi:hypothetical protein